MLQGGDFRHEVFHEHLPSHGRAFRQPQQVETFRVGDQEVGKVLAGGEDLHQRGQRRRIALEERAHAQRTAGLGHETVQVIQCHVRIGAAWQRLGKLLADQRHQIQRHARRRHIHQRRVPVAQVGYAQRLEELLRGISVVQPVADGRNFEACWDRRYGHRRFEMRNSTL